MTHLLKARSAIGRGTIYVLGKGGYDPKKSHPGDSCDCSGFVAWCLGIPRKQEDTIGYIETTRVYKDALNANILFQAVDNPRDAHVVVYPDTYKLVQVDGGKVRRQKVSEGHIGIVSGPGLVIHCSKSNYKRTRDAIQETSDKAFLAKGAVFARFKGLS